jgi:hypothetical protein
MGLSASAPFAVAAAERGEPFPCAVELPGDHRLDGVVRRGGRGLAQWLSGSVAQWLSGVVRLGGMAPGLRRLGFPALAAAGTRAGHLRAELDHAPAGDIRLISLRAGQGRDVIGVLAGHPRRNDVRARLVGLDERNVAVARQAARAAGLDGVPMLQADAGITDVCTGAVPTQIVVVCGIFGNITVSDNHVTVETVPSLCAPSALVLWTRHRGPPLRAARK